MYHMRNRLISLALGEKGGLEWIGHENGVRIDFEVDDLRVETDFGLFSTLDAEMPRVHEAEGAITFEYDARTFRVSVEYRIGEEGAYCRRYICIDNPSRLSVYRLTARHALRRPPREVLDYNTFWNCPTVGFVRYEDGGLFTGFEHPFFSVTGDRALVETTFEPSLILKEGEGYQSEANFFGIYRNTGKRLEQQTPPTGMRYNGVSHTRYRNPCGHIPLDYGEVFAFQEYAREYLELRVDHFKLIFYQFFITLPQQPETDKDEQLYYHYIDNFVRMGGDLVTFNPLVRNVPPLPSSDGHWELAPSGSRAERILNYARKRGLEIGFYMGSAAGNSAYCTSSMTPFAHENRPEWKKLDRYGHCASENCIASDDFAEWFYTVQHNTIEKYGITLWDWDPGPGNGFFCYSAGHGHIPGKGAYKGFRNAMNVVKRLKQAFPKLYIQGFHGTKEYGLWGFRGFDQHECYWEQDPYYMASIYPDFSEDRLTSGGMRFQSAWNQLFRFMPPEINHALASRMTQYCLMPGDLRYLYDQLGWKYAFFSSLAVGASMTVTMIPYDLDAISHGEYLVYYRKWIPWARKNFEYARYSKPFGAQVACGAMDGFARIKGDRGFLFLFNPGPVVVAAEFVLGDEVGLYEPGDYELMELYPLENVSVFDRVSGSDIFALGVCVHMDIPSYGCVVLELHRAEKACTPVWCNLPGRLRVEGAYAFVEDCAGPDGTAETGVIVRAVGIDAVRVNGMPMPYERKGDAIEVTMQFGPRILPAALNEWRSNGRNFTVIHHRACGPLSLDTVFFVPRTIATRLERDTPVDVERQLSIIREMKEKLRRENYAWAQPYRLHLMLPFANADHVEGFVASFNGKPLSFQLADTWHDHVQARILYYADITDVVLWDEENHLELMVDAMDEDSFLGARLCYPNGDIVADVRACAAIRPPVSSNPLGMPRALLRQTPGARRPTVESAWIADGIIRENRPYVLCASVNLPADQMEGVYASAQISIDGRSGSSLRADQRLDYDHGTGLWTRELLPGSRSLLIVDGKDIHVWAVSKPGVVSEPVKVPVEWALHGF